MRSTVQFSLGVRFENAIVAYALYLWKMIWPLQLAPMYPHPGDSLALWQVAVASIVLFAVTVLVLRLRSKPYLLVGWLWFLGTLVPVIGLVQVGDQAMADRYAYVPLIGIFIMIAFGFDDLANARKLPLVAKVTPVVIVLLALGVLTWRQIGYWSNSYDLWSHTLAVTQKNFIAEDNMGGALLLLDRTDEAFQHFQAAAQINPHDPMSHTNIGAYLQEHKRLPEAIEQYQKTIELTSDPSLLSSTYANLGTAYRDLGDYAKALESYQQALALNSTAFNAYLGMGRLFEKQGNLDDAIGAYSQSVAIHPTEQGFNALGRVSQAAGRPQQALQAYQQALQLNPDSAEAQRAVQNLSHN
jgi:Tfp pilus assembly protein PilF